MAYLYIEENKINGCGEVPAIDETTINYEITDEFYQEFKENPEQYIWDIETQEPVIDPDYEAKIAQAEAERVAKLTCTKRVFALMLQELGISYTQLKELIATNEQAQLEWDLSVQLERGNPLIDIFGAHLGITSKQIDVLFKVANGEANIDDLKATVEVKE